MALSALTTLWKKRFPNLGNLFFVISWGDMQLYCLSEGYKNLNNIRGDIKYKICKMAN